MTGQQDDLVLYAVEDGVAVMTLNRPDRGNGWIGPLAHRYFSLLDAAARDTAVRAIVVTGAGSAFCVGGDGAALADMADKAAIPTSVASSFSHWYPLRIAKPIIAAINGACFGIGLQQILCCDIRIAADDAKFATAYARRGLVAEYGMSWLLPRIVGMGHAMDLLLSARLVRAPEAEKIGLVNRVVPAATLLSDAIAYARDLARLCAPSSLAEIKRQTFLDLTATLPQSYDRSAVLLADVGKSADFLEGIRSWQEQRPPAFAPLNPADGLLDLG
jgi:enoyl-CoA hydratase/carnithine racemase